MLHTAVAIHVSGNIDKRPAAQRYDAKKIASNGAVQWGFVQPVLVTRDRAQQQRRRD